jgi:hypothetical protein
MSKYEIQSWLSSASSSEEDGEPLSSLSWQRDRVLTEWPRALEFAQNKLLAGENKVRVHFLQEELLSLAKHGGELLIICGSF